MASNTCPSGPVHCSFVVANNSTIIRECTRKQCSSIYENEFATDDDAESDSDELVTTEEEQEEENRLLGARRVGAKLTNLDHFHENEKDLNYEVVIWQSSKGASSSPISNVVTLNSVTTVRLCQPTNTSSYYVERSLRHLFTQADLQIRDELIDRLDQPRADQLDWRSLASVAGFDHYLPYFASQPSPSTSILELWEAKVLNQLVQKRRKRPNKGHKHYTEGGNSPDLTEVKDIFYSKLVHLLQTIQRTDLIKIILSNQC